MPLEVYLIGDGVLPIPPLPYSALAFTMTAPANTFAVSYMA